MHMVVHMHIRNKEVEHVSKVPVLKSHHLKKINGRQEEALGKKCMLGKIEEDLSCKHRLSLQGC